MVLDGGSSWPSLLSLSTRSRGLDHPSYLPIPRSKVNYTVAKSSCHQIKETFRCHPPVSTGLPRVVPDDGLVIAGHRFAKGVSPHSQASQSPSQRVLTPKQTTVSVNSWVIHQNTDCFGKDANGYNPERWLDPERSSHMDRYMMQVSRPRLTIPTSSPNIRPLDTPLTLCSSLPNHATKQPNHHSHLLTSSNPYSSEQATTPAQAATLPTWKSIKLPPP